MTDIEKSPTTLESFINQLLGGTSKEFPKSGPPECLSLKYLLF